MSSQEEIDCTEKPTSFKFEAGEKVLCFHGPLIYESKCQQVRICEDTKTPEYLIHYLGWNKNWDEWVAENRILKFNDTNVKKQQELERALSKGKERRKIKRKGASTESKESKNSDSSSNHSSCSSSLTEEVSQPKVVLRRHLTIDENSSQVEEKDKLDSVIDGSRFSCPDIKLELQHDVTDETCLVYTKTSDFVTDSSESYDSSVDRVPSRISQRRSSRLSVESRSSSQEQELTVKEEKLIANSLEKWVEEHSKSKNELCNSDNQVEKVISYTHINVKPESDLIDGDGLRRTFDVPHKLDRRRSSAVSENGTSSQDYGLEKPKRRLSFDPRKSSTEESQQKFSANLKEKEAQKKLNIDTKKPEIPRFSIFLINERKPFIFPSILRTHLIDDWDLICRQHKLCCLPAEHTVKKILKDFISFSSTHEDLEKERTVEIVKHMKDYFDELLGNRLLHKFERSQFSNILQLYSSKKMSDIYGGPQLLRLMYVFQETDWSEMEKGDFDTFSKTMKLLIKFLVLKKDEYFTAHVYYFATVDYHREDNL